MTFATLAVSTFLLTTLDTCTRLARFLIEELFDWHGVVSRYLGTLIVLVFPALAIFLTFTTPDGVVLPVWKAIWPLFGATNQLLAAFALITFVIFLKHRRIPFGFALIPTFLMTVMPIVALILIVLQYGPISLLGSIALIMVMLGLYMTIVSLRSEFIPGKLFRTF